VPVALSAEALKELQLALHDHDVSLINTMLDKGKALSVAKNRKVAVLARYKTSVVVEIMEGSQAGKTVWVLPDFLNPLGVDTTEPRPSER
jgi:hypothetical protein